MGMYLSVPEVCFEHFEIKLTGALHKAISECCLEAVQRAKVSEYDSLRLTRTEAEALLKHLLENWDIMDDSRFALRLHGVMQPFPPEMVLNYRVLVGYITGWLIATRDDPDATMSFF